MNPTTQTELDFLLGVYRPLLTRQEATIFLADCSVNHISNLVEEGKLLGINIGNGSEEACLRIWRYSAEHLGFFPDRPFKRLNIQALLPHTRPSFWRREVAQLLGCTERHVTDLNLSGPKMDSRNLIFRDAVVEFLTNREINSPSAIRHSQSISPVRPTSMSGLDRHTSPLQAGGGTNSKK